MTLHGLTRKFLALALAALAGVAAGATPASASPTGLPMYQDCIFGPAGSLTMLDPTGPGVLVASGTLRQLLVAADCW